MLLLHVKGFLVKEDHRTAVRALVLDEAFLILIVVLVIFLFFVILVLGFAEQHFLQVADIAVELVDDLLKLMKRFFGLPGLLGKSLQRIDHGQHQFALIGLSRHAEALCQALQVCHFLAHLAHGQAAFLMDFPITRGPCRSRRGYPRGSCRRC